MTDFLNVTTDFLKLNDSFKLTEHIGSQCISEGKINDPFVTIAIPTYKRAGLLKETIDSALRLNGNIPYEILIVDNNPDRNDETENLITTYIDERIRYFKNEENIGLPGNWNRLYTLARGKWVVMIHDDDLICSNYLEDAAGYMTDNIDIFSGVFSPFTDNPVMDTSDMPLGASKVPFERLWNGSSLVIAGLAIRKEKMIEIGGFNPAYQNLDCVLITQMAYYGKAVKINKPLAQYRIMCNDSLNSTVFNNCIIGEAQRQQFILRKSIPKFLARLIQISNTLNLVRSWNLQFQVNFESPIFNNVSYLKIMASRIARKCYSFYVRFRYPIKKIRPCSVD